MSPSLNAGVVGAGSFGGHHARKYAALDGVKLIGVFDPDAGSVPAALKGVAFTAGFTTGIRVDM